MVILNQRLGDDTIPLMKLVAAAAAAVIASIAARKLSPIFNASNRQAEGRRT